MATKRKTKAQRETEQRAALEQRVLDIATGVVGSDAGDDEDGAEIIWAVNEPEHIQRFIGALESVFGAQVEHHEETYSLLTRHWMISEYKDLESTVGLLWRLGVRA